jgi:hypothetical protein
MRNQAKIAAAAVMALLAAACGSHDWHGEAFKGYYAQPSRETGQQLEERQAIMHWKSDPKQKKRIGYLEKYAIRLEGSREPHDIYYIRDAAGRTYDLPKGDNIAFEDIAAYVPD